MTFHRRTHARNLQKVARAIGLVLMPVAATWGCSGDPDEAGPGPRDAAAEGDAANVDDAKDGPDALDASDEVLDAGVDGGGGFDVTGDTNLDAPVGDTGSPDGDDAAGEAGQEDAADAADGNGDSGSDGGLGAAFPVCYFGDFDLAGSDRVACIRFPGVTREVLDAPGLAVGFEVTAAAMSPNGQTIAIAGRATPTEPIALQWVSLANGTVTTIAKAPGTTSTIKRIAFSRDGLWVAIMADFNQPGTTSLYAVPVTGGALNRVSPVAPAGLDVIDMAWSRGTVAPTVLAFVGDVHVDGVHELLTVDVSVTKPPTVPVLSDAQLGPDGDVQGGVRWDAEGHLVFRSNFESATGWRLYRSGVGGAGLGVIDGTVLDNEAGQATIASFAVSPDGERIAWSANAPKARLFEVYVMSLAAGSPPATRVSSLPVVIPGTGVVGPTLPRSITWSPLGDRLAVLADWPLAAADRDDNFSVFMIPTEEPAGGLRLLGSATEVDRNAREARFLSNGAAVVVRGDLIANGAFELFLSDGLDTADQELTAARVEDVPPQGDVLGIAEQ